MPPAPFFLLLGPLLALATACGPERPPEGALETIGALGEAETFEILALEPYRLDYDELSAAAVEHLHGYQIRSRARIDDPAVRRTIAAAIGRGLREEAGVRAACFNPRHAVRAEHDGRTTDVLVCYECFAFQIYEDERFVEGGSTSAAPAAELDALWHSRGCRVAPR